NSYGSIKPLADGQWQQQADYAKALELYTRLTREFAKGETRYFDQAQYQIKNITEPTLNVGVSNVFLPGSEIQFGLNTRNVSRVDFALYKLDLTRDIRYAKTSDADEGQSDNQSWMQNLPLAGQQPAKSWTRNIENSESHQPFGEQVRVNGQLP